jgi:N,N'-diacetylchitobiose transport system permease protein
VFVVVVFPVFWMVSTAFKPDDEINAFTPTWFSTAPTLDHFRDAIDRPYFWDTVKNSLVIVGLVVVLSMAVAFMAAVALAKYRFTGNKLFVVLMIGILMLPQAGLVIPLYVVLARYGLTNELFGVVLTHLVILLPFAVWTLRGFILGIPRELEEAAMVDGSSRFGAFARILLPLVAPGLVATRSSSSSRAGTSSSSRTSSSPTRRTTRSRSGSPTSTSPAGTRTGAGSWPPPR